MKKIDGNMIYVQFSDLKFLITNHELISRELYILIKRLEKQADDYTFVGFEGEENVEYFKELDYIIDYDQYKDLSVDELKEFVTKLSYKANQLAIKYNNLSDIGKAKEKGIDLKYEYNELYNVMNGLTDIILYKQGDVDLEIAHLDDEPKEKSFFKNWFKRKDK